MPPLPISMCFSSHLKVELISPFLKSGLSLWLLWPMECNIRCLKTSDLNPRKPGNLCFPPLICLFSGGPSQNLAPAMCRGHRENKTLLGSLSWAPSQQPAPTAGHADESCGIPAQLNPRWLQLQPKTCGAEPPLSWALLTHRFTRGTKMVVVFNY